MKVNITRSYRSVGHFNLENYSDKFLGALVRAMLVECEDDAEDTYKEVSIKVIEGDLE